VPDEEVVLFSAGLLAVGLILLKWYWPRLECEDTDNTLLLAT
jgi:hypothetical protein